MHRGELLYPHPNFFSQCLIIKHQWIMKRILIKCPESVDHYIENMKMKRDEVLALLNAHKANLAKKFGVTALALFGSTARDAAKMNSDIDILVDFDGPATSKRYFGVQFYLEDLLASPIDLVTEKALRPELRPYVKQEAIYV